MDFMLSEDQVSLAKVAGQLFARRAGNEIARATLDGHLTTQQNDFDFVAPLGVMAILADESRGGGGTVLDLAVVVEQAGRFLTPAHLVSVAGRSVTLLQGLRSAEAIALLQAVLAGERVIVVADAGAEPPSVPQVSSDGLLHGRTAPILDGTSATDVLLLAEGAAGPAVYHVDLVEHSASVRRLDHMPLDATRGLVVLQFEGVAAHAISDGADVPSVWGRARDVAITLLAAEDLGSTSEANRVAREYAQTRQTFGRPIGSFQAVKHALVDAYVGEEQLRSLVWLAAWSADADPDQLGYYAAAAAAYAADVLPRSAQTLIHTHGGIGFTWEHDAHLYWRRAQVDRVLLGTADEHRRRVAEVALGKELVS